MTLSSPSDRIASQNAPNGCSISSSNCSANHTRFTRVKKAKLASNGVGGVQSLSSLTVGNVVLVRKPASPGSSNRWIDPLSTDKSFIDFAKERISAKTATKDTSALSRSHKHSMTNTF